MTESWDECGSVSDYSSSSLVQINNEEGRKTFALEQTYVKICRYQVINTKQKMQDHRKSKCIISALFQYLVSISTVLGRIFSSSLLLNLVMHNSHPPERPTLSHDRYQPGPPWHDLIF